MKLFEFLLFKKANKFKIFITESCILDLSLHFRYSYYNIPEKFKSRNLKFNVIQCERKNILMKAELKRLKKEELPENYYWFGNG